MALPGDQDELVAAVAAANPNTIVVVNAGSPVTMPWLDAVPAVLQIWFPGQALGDALADVLTGVEEPGGRLPVTFPVRLEDTPAFAHHPGRDGRGGLRRGHVHRPPLVRPRGDRAAVPVRPRARVHDVRVRRRHGRGTDRGRRDGEGRRDNTGDRAGSEVVQVYVEPPPGDPARPLRHLAASGGSSSRRAHRRLWRSSSTGGPSRRGSTAQWTVPPGEYTVLVGRSSRDLVSAPARPRRRVLSVGIGRRARFHTDRTSQPPVDRVQAGGRQGGVGTGERSGPEEPVVRGQRRRVGRLDDRVARRVDQRPLAPRVGCPTGRTRPGAPWPRPCGSPRR